MPGLGDFLSNTFGAVSGAFDTGARSAGARQQAQQWWEQAFESQAREEARRYDATLQVQQDTLKNNYRIALMNARSEEERNRITEEYNRAQVELAKGRLGLEYLSTAAQLRGPEDYFQQSDFMRGASERQDVPIFVQALQNNQRMPAFQAPGGAPTAVSAEGMLGQMTGQGGAGGTNVQAQNDSALAAIKGIGAAGGIKLGGGALEQLSKDELGLLKSGIEKGGPGQTALSWDTFLSGYNRSRVRNNAASAKVA